MRKECGICEKGKRCVLAWFSRSGVKEREELMGVCA